MSKLLVSSIRDGQEVNSFFLVRSRSLRSFRGKPGAFLVLGLSDRSGEIEAKLWENGEDWYWKLREQDVVAVTGRTKLFGGNLELTIDRLRAARDDEYQPEDFLPSTDKDIEQMKTDLQNTIARVSNPSLNALLNIILDEDGLRTFSQAPAAKAIHHAYLGGLLEHTLEVICLCDACLAIYPSIDADILLTGAILHDIGKTREYVYRRCIDFSDEGRLLGHISLGEQIVVSKASAVPGFPQSLLVHLRHLILSHHGQYEWQSPKRPKTIEACVLHQSDFLSGQVAIFSAAIRANRENSPWTAFNKYLDRQIFVGNQPFRALEDDPVPHSLIMEDLFADYE